MNEKQITEILDSGRRAAIAITGGGSGAIHSLLSTPGASRFVADVRIPYSAEALKDFLGEQPEQSCSLQTARAMANVGQASCLSCALGIGCTAALQTNRERRGEDRAFICIKTEQNEKLYVIYFSNSSRAEQEARLSEWLLLLIAQAVGAERNLILPGSFNPAHKGHYGLLKAAEQITGLRGVFELSAANVDKPDIPEDEILQRVSAIRDIPVALTRAPRFIQKAQLFPNTTFVLGYDTAERLLNPAYCLETPCAGTRPAEENKCRPGTLAGRWAEMWERFQSCGINFLVAGRIFQCLETNSWKRHSAVGQRLEASSAQRSRFQCRENLDLPAGYELLFESIPEDDFREDISSSELRPESVR